MDSARTEALLEAVRAVQDSVSRLEREIMAAMAEDGRRTSPPPDSSDKTAEWFTLAELGEWLKVSRTTAYRLVSTREIPAYRIGRAMRVRRADIERWLEENRWEVGG
jgi:excisionase family DNA binding protein